MTWPNSFRAPASAPARARQLDVPTNRITEIINAQRAITGDTALRLAHFFGISAESWITLQNRYELHLAQRKAGRWTSRRSTPQVVIIVLVMIVVSMMKVLIMVILVVARTQGALARQHPESD